MSKLVITVTEEHVARASQIETLLHDLVVSAYCPVTLAVYDALGRTPDIPALAQLGFDFDVFAPIWSAGSTIGIDGYEYEAPPVVRTIADWFDGWGEEPTLPVDFALEVN